MSILSDYWNKFQESLFPHLEAVSREHITDRLMQLVRVIDVVRVERYVDSPFSQCMGRKQIDRRSIARAYLAKSVLDIPTTELLLDRLKMDRLLRQLCGFERAGDVPSASTFSRAFAEFATLDIGDRIHEALVREYVGDKVVVHVSRDSTAVRAREKPARKTKRKRTLRQKLGRPKRGEPSDPRGPRRIPTQLTQDPWEALGALPRTCDKGCKRDSGGCPHPWTGWKVHIDWADGGVPLLAVTTSASVDDSQAAIPMAKITARRVTSLYDLMDCAYDVGEIRQLSEQLGHVPVIQPKPKRITEDNWPAYRRRRYKERTTAERGNSRLKNEFGFGNLRVRGHSKAHMHLMFGVLALFADALYCMHRT
jgi:hypothetical protein